MAFDFFYVANAITNHESVLFNFKKEKMVKSERWVEGRRCGKAGCNFAHGPSELRRHYITRPTPCAFILDGFDCYKGVSCTYRHALTAEEEAQRNLRLRFRQF